MLKLRMLDNKKSNKCHLNNYTIETPYVVLNIISGVVCMKLYFYIQLHIKR